MEEKKIGKIQGRIRGEGMFSISRYNKLSSTFIPKYDHSSLYGCWDLFGDFFHSSTYGRKENWTNTGKNKQEKPGSQSQDTSHHQPSYQI